MIQSSHRFGLAAPSPTLSDSGSAGWAGVLGFAALTLGPFGLATRAFTQLLTAHPPNCIQTNLTTKRRDQTGGLIESCTRLKSPPPSPLATPLTGYSPGKVMRNRTHTEEPTRLSRNLVQRAVEAGTLHSSDSYGNLIKDSY